MKKLHYLPFYLFILLLVTGCQVTIPQQTGTQPIQRPEIEPDYRLNPPDIEIEKVSDSTTSTNTCLPPDCIYEEPIGIIGSPNPETDPFFVPDDLIDLPPSTSGQWSKQLQEKLTAQAIAQADPTICYKSREHLASYGDYEDYFTAADAMNDCLYQYAYRTNDLVICDLMNKEKTSKYIRYGSCITELQSRTNLFSEANCKKIYDAGDDYNGDQCIYRVAGELEDEAMCNRWLEDNLLSQCISNVQFRKGN